MNLVLTRAEVEGQLIDSIAEFVNDPLGYVLFAFPWGEVGSELEHDSGPRDWQRQELEEIGTQLREGKTNANEVIQRAIASGHGIGKSAEVAWIILWALSTMPDTRGVVTANTDAQLRTKTWAELATWYRRCINAHWFTFTATALFASDPAHEKTWRIDAVPWSERRTEAFAGLHNKGKRVLVIFDEASAIPDPIWQVTEGALTDESTELIWLVYGNPTRNAGRFRECFGRFRHRWACRQIDSRTVDGTNKEQLDKWIADYGEESDFARVRVRGEFPMAGSMQFIASDLVHTAASRPAQAQKADPVVLGVDVARFGDDESVLCYRCGRDARTIQMKCLRGLDTMQLAAQIVESIRKVGAYGIRVDGVFVDETGVGGGVVDRLRQLGVACIGVNNGAKTDVPVVDGAGGGELVANKGAECWARMRLWLKQGSIIDDQALISQLETREYSYNAHNELVLESKADMKRRGLESPDRADALALTFAYPVAMLDDQGRRAAVTGAQRADMDYSPLAGMRRR